MIKITTTSRFSKEYELMKRRGKKPKKLKQVVDFLQQGSVPAKYRDHKLIGNYEGSRELHIEPDWLLIYRIQNQLLILERTGTHSDLFKN